MVDKDIIEFLLTCDEALDEIFFVTHSVEDSDKQELFKYPYNYSGLFQVAVDRFVVL